MPWKDSNGLTPQAWPMAGSASYLSAERKQRATSAKAGQGTAGSSASPASLRVDADRPAALAVSEGRLERRREDVAALDLDVLVGLERGAQRGMGADLLEQELRVVCSGGAGVGYG